MSALASEAAPSGMLLESVPQAKAPITGLRPCVDVFDGILQGDVTPAGHFKNWRNWSHNI